MRNVLVTGGAGFIGSNFIHYIFKVDENVNVVNLDILTYAGRLDNLDGVPKQRYKFVKGDICDMSLVDWIVKEYKIDTIVNFAAETQVDTSIKEPALFVHTNVTGTFTLLEVAKKYGIRYHQISTDEVYGSLELDAPPFTENSPYNPRSPYSASKASADHLVMAYHHTYDLPVTISYASNNCGPRQHIEKLIPKMIYHALNGQALTIHGDGKQIRDWIYVDDNCAGIHKVLTDGKIGETYLIGGENQKSVEIIVQHIRDILDMTTFVRYVEDRPGQDRRYALDCSKMHALGWERQHDFEHSLYMTVNWYLDNKDWMGIEE